jgi:putative N6-adenine-specific DNA methylase
MRPVFLNAKYFLVIQPEFEELAQQELAETVIEFKRNGFDLGVSNLTLVSGGLEFVGNFPECLYLNHCLKIPSRLLMRLGSFFSKTFPLLESEFRKINFKNISKITPQNFQVAASKSKLNNEKRILECIRRIYPEKSGLDEKKSDAESPLEIYVRMFDDQCTVSVDTSGDHLHFRGYREKQGVAPLRENFAAGLLQLLFKNISWNELSNTNLIDPMVGSGTFLFEAALWNCENFVRTYAYQHWLKPEVLKSFNGFVNEFKKKKTQSGQYQRQHQKILFNQLLGFDNDLQVISLAQENLKNLLKFNTRTSGISFEVADVFTVKDKLEGSKNFVICNPPYGGRLKIKDSRDDYFQNLVNRITQNYNPYRFGILIPTSVRTPKAPENFKEMDSFSFLNNGIRVKFLIFESLKFSLNKF